MQGSPGNNAARTDPASGLAERVTALTRQLGRPVRVLQLGNVANYAYVNALLLRQAGIEADVLDPDFYHIMATPEWHGADFEAGFADQFLPRWSGVRPAGFERPPWFVQGPLVPALAALEARAAARPLPVRALAALDLDLSVRRVTGDYAGAASRWWLSDPGLPARLARAPVAALIRLARWLRGPAGEAPAMPAGFPPDLAAPPELRARLARLMAHYDIVQGWTLSAQLAAQAGHRRYVACELGTLRGLPWQDTPEGRLAAWLYRSAPEVFVTNSDCLPLAARLGVAPERTTPILHPYDLASIPQAPAPPAPPGPDGPILLAPARHHWTSGSGAWLKGNDVYLRALGRLAAQGRPFRLVTVRWGAEVAQSQALIEELGFADRVTWVEPAPRMAMWRAYGGAAAVLDQFAAETFGGAGLDTMAAGRRLITRFDPATALPFFQNQPPLTAVTGVDGTTAAIAAVLDDPEDRTGGGAALRDWLLDEFQLDRQLGPQLTAYERLLRNDPA